MKFKLTLGYKKRKIICIATSFWVYNDVYYSYINELPVRKNQKMKNLKGFNKEDILELADKKIIEGKKVKAIVAFVDLLGFSSELALNWDQNSDDFLHRIMRIKSFTELCKINGNPHEFYDYDEVTFLDSSQYPELITFSDSFIFIKEIDETSPQTKITSVLAVLGSILELWRYAIEEGFTLRGAIDFGEFYYGNNEIIGPAFISTYQMESKIAKISRILCSSQIATIIDENIKSSAPRFSDYVQLYIKKDIDDKLIMNPCIAFNLLNHQNLDEAKARVEKMRLKATDHDARNKYHDLIERLDRRSLKFSDMDIFRT